MRDTEADPRDDDDDEPPCLERIGPEMAARLSAALALGMNPDLCRVSLTSAGIIKGDVCSVCMSVAMMTALLRNMRATGADPADAMNVIMHCMEAAFDNTTVRFVRLDKNGNPVEDDDGPPVH